MHSRRACWAVTCAWDLFGTGERGPVGDSAAWGAPVDQTKVLRTNQPCWTLFLLAHRLKLQLFFSFLSFLLFSSISISNSISNLQPPSSPHMGRSPLCGGPRNQPPHPPFQLHRNSCPSASGYTSVPAAFSESAPSLHEQASVGTAFNSGNPSSKRVIDLRHDM
jgi:hypothetical protein